MLAEKIRFFVFTGSKTTDRTQPVDLYAINRDDTCTDVTNWLLFDQRCCSDY